MKVAVIVGGVLIVLVGVRFAWGYFASRVARPVMTVLQGSGDIQIRQTRPQIYASVTVTSTQADAPGRAFGILAGFIFGGNVSRDKVAMTAPVLSTKIGSDSEGQRIAMTAPVISTPSTRGKYQVSFVMPAEYTMDTLPVPLDDRIVIHTMPAQTIGVITFDGYTTASRIERYTQELLSGLQAMGVTTTGETSVAQYNDPWTPWIMRTNEIWVPVSL